MKSIRWEELAAEMLTILAGMPRSAVGLAARGMASMGWLVLGGVGALPIVLLVFE